MAGQRHHGRRQVLTRTAPIVAATLGLAACSPPPPPPEGAVPLDTIVAGLQLAGTWEWIHFEVEDQTLRRERERWRFVSTDDPRRLVGRYRRDVLVRALDGVPFSCNQTTRYHQRTDLFVRADVMAGGITVTELSYRAEPGPCDPGLRQLGSYLATVRRDRMRLAWPDGEALLERGSDDEPVELEPAPVAEPPGGRWVWAATSWTRAGLIRDEREDWEVAAGEDGVLGGTYLREVVVRSPDGRPLPCAGAAAYGWVDRYLVRGEREDASGGGDGDGGDGGDGWRLEETSVIAGVHPCLAETPARTLDSGRLVADGEHVVVTWRGKRRQVLIRNRAD